MSNKTILCFGYEEDLNQIYAFYCARYENISWEEFMKLNFYELSKKLNSIPESEPLFKIIKSRTIDLSKIKNKEERKYWRELKKANSIPQLYLSTQEIYSNLRKELKNGRKFNKI